MTVKNIFKNIISDFNNWLNCDQNKVGCETSNYSPVSSGVPMKSNSLGSLNAVNFAMFAANGGKIIQTSSYDIRTDRNTNNLYIITDDQDLGEELSMILTRESLGR